MRPLDDWLATFDFVEHHETHVAASPEKALAAALGVDVVSDRVARTLFRLRGVRQRGALGGAGALPGAVELERTPTRWVIGLAGRPWQRRGGLVALADAEAWRAFEAQGSVRMALALWAEPAGSGSRLETETRIAALDPEALRVFRRYWLFVRPFSGLIRTRWLVAAERALR